MNKIYRLRPADTNTVNELERGYLWFSKPTEYRDTEDANILACAEKNSTVKEIFNRLFGDYEDLGNELCHLGMSYVT